MIKYDKYKPSGVDWLGDIPKDWEVKRVKDIGNVQLGKMLNNNPQENYFLKPYLKSKNINWLNVNVNSVEEMYFNEYELKQYRIKKDDILLSEGGEVGKTCIWLNELEECYIQNSVHKISIFKNNIPRYYLYLSFSLGVSKYYDNIVNQVSIKHLTYEKLIKIIWLVPSKIEQIQIANYLDIKTQAIDKKIRLLTQKSNYYKEYRKSLINETVCKGLDKNVKSKITELGFNVNENYSFFRLKDLGYLYSGLSGKAGEDFNQDENPNNKGFIPFTNIANNIYLKKDHLGTVVVYDNENQNKVKKEDVFFLMSSEGYEDIGKSAILDDDLNETYLNSFCKGYRVNNRKANPYFLNYLLLSDNYRKQLTVEGKGFTRINLKMEKVNDFIVFIPNTIDEQKKIVSFLDDKTQTIDKIVSNIHTQIQTLKELRKTLINDAVIGKIKVV